MSLSICPIHQKKIGYQPNFNVLSLKSFENAPARTIQVFVRIILTCKATRVCRLTSGSITEDCALRKWTVAKT